MHESHFSQHPFTVLTACLFEKIPVAAYVVYRTQAHRLEALDARDFARLEPLFNVADSLLPAPVGGDCLFPVCIRA